MNTSPTNPDDKSFAYKGKSLVQSILGNKRLLLLISAGVLAVIVTGIVIFMLTRPAGDQSAQLFPISPTVANVSIDTTGYTPQTIKIKKGQEITWTNADKIPHRITADPEALPGLDTTESLEPGDTYTYIFESGGTYNYYDPADPNTFVATVTVE